jgi:putative nucleotidyltransferase with HDIG domain
LSAPAFVHRLHQIGLALRKRTAPIAPPKLFPNEATWRLFQDLHAHDQRHLLAVHQKAVAAGLPEHLCQAGLLHDIGKVTLTRTRINLAARITHVLLGRLFPALGRAIAADRSPWTGVGMHLAAGHARIGAERLRALGVDERICQVVEVHDDPEQPDPDIRRLQEIDSATP